MRYAIFSDIHANHQAWEAVLADIDANECDVLICLGDAVGYGPRPLEVLTSIRERSQAFVLGNHDAAACGKLDSSIFNENAQAGIAHTRALLDEESLEFLNSVPYATEIDDILFVHAEVAFPDRFDYVETIEKAHEDFAASPHRCTFLGHTHMPTVFMEEGGSVTQIPDEDFRFAPGQRYNVNVGSVGEPRNPEDLRARYVIFDQEEGIVYFRRVDFDAEAYRADLAASGSNAYPYFLQILDHDTEVREFIEAAAHDMQSLAKISGEGVQIARLELSDLTSIHEASREVTKKSARITTFIFLAVFVTLALVLFGRWVFDPERRDLAADPLGMAEAPAPVVIAANAPEAQALFGYWPFDKGTKGYAGRAPFQAFGVGKPGQAKGKYSGAIQLDASSGLVFGKDRTYAIRDGSFTVSMWVQLVNPSESPIRLIGNGARSKTEPGWLISLQGGVLKFLLGSGTNRAQITGLQAILTDTEWHHVAMVRDIKAGELLAYFDGFEIGKLNVSSLGDQIPASHPLRIGHGGSEDNMAGMGGNVDDLAIWRRALTADEIDALFLRKSALKGAFGGPIHAASVSEKAQGNKKAQGKVFADFEGGTYGDWKVEGEAFGDAPAPGGRTIQVLTGFKGKGVVNSWTGSDELKGKLTSPTFQVEKPYINFLLGGGANKNDLTASLWVNGKKVRSATGKNSDAMEWVSWKVADLKGKQAHFEIVDAVSGGWGHIVVDQIEFSSHPAVQAATGGLEKRPDFGSIA